MKREDFLTVKQREYYEQKRNAIAKTLEDIKRSEFAAVRAVDKQPLIKIKKECEQILEARTPPKISGTQKNEVYERYKQLETELKNEMIPFSEMHPTVVVDGKRVVDWDKAKQVALEHVKRIEAGQDKKKVEFRNLGRLLDRDNPNVGSAERLRHR